MSMPGPKIGTWWVRSKLDPRWNGDGKGLGLVTSGGPIEMRNWIEKCKKEYGKPPDDAEMGFMKD